MFDSIPAHIKFMHGNDIFREIITNRIVNAEFPM